MKTEKPKAGWGILEPDDEIKPETEALLERLGSLSNGQRDAVLARCIPRHLTVVMDLGENPDPDASDMVSCTTTLSNIWFDMLGRP